jgi:hypothetical protein
MFSSLYLSTKAYEIKFTSTVLLSIINMPSIKPVYDSIALRRIGVRLNSTLFTPITSLLLADPFSLGCFIVCYGLTSYKRSSSRDYSR